MATKLFLVWLFVIGALCRANAEELELERYVLHQIQNGEIVILLDTRTGQNWSAKPVEEWSSWPSTEERKKLSRRETSSVPRTPIKWYPNFFVTSESSREVKFNGQTNYLPFWAGQFTPPSPEQLGKPDFDERQME